MADVSKKYADFANNLIFVILETILRVTSMPNVKSLAHFFRI